MSYMYLWSISLSIRQRRLFFGIVCGAALLILYGNYSRVDTRGNKKISVDTTMTIQSIARELDVTGRALARELRLPLDIEKNMPLDQLGIHETHLSHTVAHLVSHHDAREKYFVYLALVVWALLFLVFLGRPARIAPENRKVWYPHGVYIGTLFAAVILGGFASGKSPNPMEATVKLFKSMTGLYFSPLEKGLLLSFFVVLSVIGNKMMCGWACPFGALQELVYSLPLFRHVKRRNLPFFLTNTIRIFLFFVMVILLFNIVGDNKGFVVYHYLNPFNLFQFNFDNGIITAVIIASLVLSFIVYRPFCHCICPFGLVSWIAEQLSVYRVTINKATCIHCGHCISVCPSEALKNRIDGTLLPADCFSCARCLNVCPVDAITFQSRFQATDKKKAKSITS